MVDGRSSEKRGPIVWEPSLRFGGFDSAVSSPILSSNQNDCFINLELLSCHLNRRNPPPVDHVVANYRVRRNQHYVIRAETKSASPTHTQLTTRNRPFHSHEQKSASNPPPLQVLIVRHSRQHKPPKLLANLVPKFPLPSLPPPSQIKPPRALRTIYSRRVPVPAHELQLPATSPNRRLDDFPLSRHARLVHP